MMHAWEEVEVGGQSKNIILNYDTGTHSGQHKYPLNMFISHKYEENTFIK